jgi:hypothetical protein
VTVETAPVSLSGLASLKIMASAPASAYAGGDAGRVARPAIQARLLGDMAKVVAVAMRGALRQYRQHGQQTWRMRSRGDYSMAGGVEVIDYCQRPLDG